MYQVGDIVELTTFDPKKWSYYLCIRNRGVNQYVYTIDWISICPDTGSSGNAFKGNVMTWSELQQNGYKRSSMTLDQFNMLHTLYYEE